MLASLPSPSEDEHLALDVCDDDESDEQELAQAEPIVDAFIDRSMEALAEPLLGAIERAIQDGLAPDDEAAQRWMLRVSVLVAERATALSGLSIARQLFSTVVGAEPGGPVEHRLAIMATPTVDLPEFAGLSGLVDDWLRAAYPDVQRDGPSPLPRGLRRVRVAVVWPADLETVAAALAAEHPGLIPVAAKLVQEHRDIDAALDAFDAGLARARGRSDAPASAPEAEADERDGPHDQGPARPPRRFTRYHLGFAIIIALLTFWHYVLR